HQLSRHRDRPQIRPVHGDPPGQTRAEKCPPGLGRRPLFLARTGGAGLRPGGACILSRPLVEAEAQETPPLYRGLRRRVPARAPGRRQLERGQRRRRVFSADCEDSRRAAGSSARPGRACISLGGGRLSHQLRAQVSPGRPTHPPRLLRQARRSIAFRFCPDGAAAPHPSFPNSVWEQRHWRHPRPSLRSGTCHPVDPSTAPPPSSATPHSIPILSGRSRGSASLVSKLRLGTASLAPPTPFAALRDVPPRRAYAKPRLGGLGR